MVAVSGPVQNRRRKTGASGLPSGGLYSGEIFFNFVDGTINFGVGSNGASPDMATSTVTYTLASLLDAISAQTVSGVKTFSASPVVPTPAAGDTSTKAANAAFVASAIVAAISGRDSKESVRAASTSNITLSGPGATVGGVTMNAGDRFAALAQTTNTEPGIYVWNGASSAATRAPDAVQGNVSSGMFFFVEEGTLAGKGYELTTANPITLGTTALTFQEFDAQGAAQASYTGVDGGYA